MALRLRKRRKLRQLSQTSSMSRAFCFPSQLLTQCSTPTEMVTIIVGKEGEDERFTVHKGRYIPIVYYQYKLIRNRICLPLFTRLKGCLRKLIHRGSDAMLSTGRCHCQGDPSSPMLFLHWKSRYLASAIHLRWIRSCG